MVARMRRYPTTVVWGTGGNHGITVDSIAGDRCSHDAYARHLIRSFVSFAGRQPPPRARRGYQGITKGDGDLDGNIPNQRRSHMKNGHILAISSLLWAALSAG